MVLFEKTSPTFFEDTSLSFLMKMCFGLVSKSGQNCARNVAQMGRDLVTISGTISGSSSPSLDKFKDKLLLEFDRFAC